MQSFLMWKLNQRLFVLHSSLYLDVYRNTLTYDTYAKVQISRTIHLFFTRWSFQLQLGKKKIWSYDGHTLFLWWQKDNRLYEFLKEIWKDSFVTTPFHDSCRHLDGFYLSKFTESSLKNGAVDVRTISLIYPPVKIFCMLKFKYNISMIYVCSII